MDYTAPDADWTAFDTARDLPALRARLAERAAAEGVTGAHHRVSERIPDLRVLPPVVHKGDLQGVALSPCGRYLAIAAGIEVPEGEWHDEYEVGGTLHIFEMSTGGRVGGITEPGALRGGVGWSDYPGAVQWSADSSRIGLAYDTNQVGVWDSFAGEPEPIASADVTDGGNRPPSFALAPDGRRAFIDVGGPSDEHAVPGCVVPLESGELSWYPHGSPPVFGESGPRSMSPILGPPFEETPGELVLDMERVLGWAPDGTRVHALDFRDVYAIDLATGRPLWIHEHGMDYSYWDPTAPAAFSPDGARVAWYTGEQLFIADAATGEVRGEFERGDVAVLVWGAGGLAAIGPQGVRIFAGDAETAAIPATVPVGKGVLADIVPLTWSPDGTRIALATVEGQVEVWNPGDTTDPAARFAAPEAAEGVYWGDTLAVLNRTHVRFCTPEGATLGEVALHDVPESLSAGGRHAWPAHWAAR